MDAEDLLKGLAALSSMKADGAKDRTDLPIEELARSYLKTHEFKVGDRIVMKKGMGGVHKIPKSGQVCVVVEVLEQAYRPEFEKTFGTPHFMMPHDIRVAVKDPDGDFMCFMIDSRLFEPVKGGKVVELKQK